MNWMQEVGIGDSLSREVSAAEEQLAGSCRERNICMGERYLKGCRKMDKLGTTSLNVKKLSCMNQERVEEAMQEEMRNNSEDLQMSSKGWSSEELEKGRQTLT